MRNRKSLPDAWEAQIIESVLLDPQRAKGAYTDVTEADGRRSFRILLPEYYTGSCLSSHGEPKGEIDVTGHADRIVALGKSMLDALKPLAWGNDSFRISIGVHTGPVIAGLIGRYRFVYDLWGETVNIASRLESQGVADRMQISEATKQALRTSWELEPRCNVELAGVGRIETYLVQH
ncbi:adenylate/guanylate cyclase domain-containing protein [Mesorhizobium sp. M0664]